MTPVSELPFVTIIVPCRDEYPHIRRVLGSVLKTTYPREKLEALFVDGMSSDGTRELLLEAAARHPFIRLLDNPRKTAPAALNVGIKAARGEVIARMDGHSQYPSRYLEGAVRLLLASGAGVAGGPVLTLPGGKSKWARAVAVVTRHPLGVGNSKFRTLAHGGGGPRPAETVPCGVWLKRVLEEVGLFDERLTRNQDNELTARLRRLGYTVLLDPGLRFRYWNQATLKGLARQGWHTGKWNVYTAALHPYTFSARRLAPAALVLYLACVAALAAAGSSWTAPAAAPLALYALLVASVSAAARRAGGGALRVAATVVSYHLCYGLGTHVGLADVATGRWRGRLGRPLRP